MTICASALAMMLMAVSCQPEETSKDPSFPTEYKEKTVLPGESVEFSFTANMDWTLSVEGSGAGNYFGIQDEGILETKVSGHAGDHKVNVYFTDDNDFDNDRTCLVVLSMGGKEKEIGKLVRNATNRTIAVYQAVWEDGEYKMEGDSYVYEEEHKTILDLRSKGGKAEYTVPVKIETNFSWLLNTENDAVTSSVAESNGGSVEVLFTMTPAQSLEGVETVKFNLLTSESADAKKYSFTLNIPEFKNRMETTFKEEYNFNKEGQLLLAVGAQPLPAVGYAFCASGAKVLALDWNAKGYFEIEAASWLHDSIAMAESETPAYFNNYTVSITADENSGAERMAAILVLPASLASITPESVCTEDGSAIKEEYLPYYVCDILQEGVVPAFIEADPDFTEADNNYILAQDPSDYAWVADEYETSQVFKLTYTDMYSFCHIKLAQPYASYEVQDYDGNIIKKEGFWLEFLPVGSGNDKGAVWMDAENLPENPVSFLIFRDAEDRVLAVVVCEFNANAAGGDSADNIFSLSKGSGSVKKLAAGDEDYDAFKSSFNITEIYDVTVSTRDNNLDLVSTMEFWNIIGMDDKYMDVDLAKYDDFWVDANSSNQLRIRVPETVTSKKHFYLVFQGEGDKIFAVVRFTWDPDAKGEESAPISFVYPDMARNATLGPCSDECFRIVKGEFGSTIPRDIVYELRYTGRITGPEVLLNVPSDPGLAWNNPENDEYYWLTRQMEGKQMFVTMTDKGKIDFFAWMTNYMPTLILVCTYE